MDNLDKFLEMSSLVGNENRLFNTAELEQIVNSMDFDFIRLKSFDAIKNKEPIVEKKGIQNCLIEADLGIAETGTVVTVESDEISRRATSLSENLYVVLPVSRIVKNLTDCEELLIKATDNQTGVFVSFITGASRTADIEMSLSMGVHGPQTMTIFIVKDL